MGRFTRNNGYLVKGVEPDAFQALCDYPWPGNVRELENVIERLIVTGRHEMARVEDLPAEIRLQRGLAMKPKRERRRTSPTTCTRSCAKSGSRSGPRSIRCTWRAKSPARTSAT